MPSEDRVLYENNIAVMALVRRVNHRKVLNNTRIFSYSN